MKKIILLLLIVSNMVFAQSQLTGREIMDEVSLRHDSPYEYETQEMVLIDSKNNEEKREVRRYSRKGKNDLFKYLLVFDKPAGVNGVALLTWQNEKKDDDQWMYLPALSKVKRIAKGGRKNYFMGTDYAFEDLSSEDNDNFKYTRKADIQIDGQDCFVIEVYPNTKEIKKSSGYKYRTIYVRKDLFFTIQVDYFNKRGKFVKQQKLSDLVKIKDKMYRAQTSIMDNMKENHKTKILTKKRSFSKNDVPQKIFKQRYIKSERHMKSK